MRLSAMVCPTSAAWRGRAGGSGARSLLPAALLAVVEDEVGHAWGTTSIAVTVESPVQVDLVVPGPNRRRWHGERRGGVHRADGRGVEPGVPRRADPGDLVHIAFLVEDDFELRHQLHVVHGAVPERHLHL